MPTDDEKQKAEWGLSVVPLVAKEVVRRRALNLPLRMTEEEVNDFLRRAKEACLRALQANEIFVPTCDKPDAIVVNGYMGNADAWCYYDEEYTDEGSVGPFDEPGEAAAHASRAGYRVLASNIKVKP